MAMTLGSPIPAPKPASGRAPATVDTGARPWCTVCNTDSYIFVETVVEATPNQSEIVEVSYTCSECDTFYAHAVRLDALVPAIQSEFLSTSAAGLWFSCTHCGDPMTLGRPTERVIERPGPLTIRTVPASLRCTCRRRCSTAVVVSKWRFRATLDNRRL